MGYEKTSWQTGDTVTAEKLNKIEDGIENASSGGGGLLVETEYVTDIGEYNDNGFKTIMDADDIFDAYKAGSSVVFHFEGLPSSGYVAEGYISLTGYYPDSIGNAIYLSSPPNWLGNITIEDEKIFFAIYSD